jgi:DNA-binding beta-propeller fold protein YncE
MKNQGMKTLLTMLASALVLLTAGASGAGAAYTGPVKEDLATHFGREVNLTETGKGPALEDFCDQKTGDTCSTGKESSIAGGFAQPRGVAVKDDPTNPQIFVADTINNRVQEISATGAFISMFGWEVNQTKVQAVKAKEAKGETPSAGELREENVCTAASGDTCQAGVAGTRAEQLNAAEYSIVVDQSNGDVLIEDDFNARVDEYTATGQFVLMIGGDVNETKTNEGAPQDQRDVCTLVSGDTCKAGVEDTGAGAFRFCQGCGDLLAVDDSEHLLYVGDEHRVQEFDTETGEWKGEISLVSVSAEPLAKVVALALEEATGDLYVAYSSGGVGGGVAHTIHVFDATGKQIEEFPVRKAISISGEVTVMGLAVDAFGRLAVAEAEFGGEGGANLFGAVYEGATGHRVSGFAISGVLGVAFNASGEQDELFGAMSSRVAPSGSFVAGDEVVGYAAVHVAELLATLPLPCVAGGGIMGLRRRLRAP